MSGSYPPAQFKSGSLPLSSACSVAQIFGWNFFLFFRAARRSIAMVPGALSDRVFVRENFICAIAKLHNPEYATVSEIGGSHLSLRSERIQYGIYNFLQLHIWNCRPLVWENFYYDVSVTSRS
jgi:hypothetical protein